MEGLTKGERRALEAVAAGKVERLYRNDGNVFKPPQGVSVRSLWFLDRKGLIRDGESDGGILQARIKMMLTPAGEYAMTTGNSKTEAN